MYDMLWQCGVAAWCVTVRGLRRDQACTLFAQGCGLAGCAVQCCWLVVIELAGHTGWHRLIWALSVLQTLCVW